MSLKAALALTLSLATACSVFAPKGPSAVARGEYYAAGTPEFDAFFIELHQNQVELLTAPNAPADARKNVAQAVALAPNASDDSLSERINQETKKLASQGLRLRLDVPEPSHTLDASAALLASETSPPTPLRAILPQEATRLVRSRNRMLAAKAGLDKLQVSSITLEANIEPAFRTEGPWKREQVRKNLSDAQKLISLMQTRAEQVKARDDELLALLVRAASTDASLGKLPASPPPATEDAAKPSKHPGIAKAAPISKPVANAAAPKPAATPVTKPAPKRGDDEATSAPKPVQGNAPAEIEP